MSKLKYVTDVFLDDFKTNFKSKYLPLYMKGDKEKIREIFSNSENVLESENPDASIKNIQIIWESLRELSITEAENEKVWVALENTYYLDYHLDQLEMITGKKKEASIISRTIFNNGNKRSLMINNISILWWIAYYNYDERLEDPYYYTKRFLSGSYRGNAVAYFSSNLVSNKEIVLGTLEAIYELIDENKMIENRFSYSNANKILNLVGGVVVLDFLSRDEIKNIVKENLLNTEKIKVVE